MMRFVQKIISLAIMTSALGAYGQTTHLHARSQTFGGDGESGDYLYDGSGNIIAIGTDTFLYDAEGRLVRATIRGVQEDYTYDEFGNRKTAIGATNCMGTPPCAMAVTVSSSTNHLTNSGVTYDDAGSITAASGATYSYDGTGMMIRSTAGSDDCPFFRPVSTRVCFECSPRQTQARITKLSGFSRTRSKI